MLNFPLALTSPFHALGRFRSLTWELAKRDVLGRYRGAHFGLLWSLLGPLFTLIIYSIAFGSIMKSRWVSSQGEMADFTPILFLGIIVHGLFAECISRAPKLMQENASYVKRVVFPLPILSWVSILSALFHVAMNLIVFILIAGAYYHDLAATVVWVPVVLLPLVLLCVAASWFLSALGPYFKDLGQVMPIVSTAMFFLSSAIIPVDTLDEKYKLIFYLNPLTFFIDQTRNVALWNQLPNFNALAIATVCSLALMYLAHSLFRKASTGFSDVL